MDTEARRREHNADVLAKFFAHLNLREYEQALDLLADDSLWEMPFAPHAAHAPFDRGRFGKLLRNWPAAFSRGLTLLDVDISPMLDPNRFVVEFRGEAVIAATGQLYENTYIAVFEFSDGRIAHVREYFEPIALIRACGWPLE